jgi:SAM-dependent methyltransferase
VVAGTAGANLAEVPPRLDRLRRRARTAAGLLRQPGGAGRLATAAALRAVPSPRWDDLPARAAIRLAYEVLLGREPDPHGLADLGGRLERGELDRTGLLEILRGSGEFQSLGFRDLGPSLHASRCQFVRSLPRARRILDLGGTALGNPAGAFVSMGYPYEFHELVLVDLPPDERHPLYAVAGPLGIVPTDRGPVRYAYHSMTDLGRYGDGTFDLVYSGQTIEHVTEAEGDLVLKEVHRVLRPGGWFAVDTPNARACRLQQDDFVDPDHEVEYTRSQLEDKLAGAGFTVAAAYGLNHLGRCFAEGRFSMDDAAGHPGMFAEVDDCYLLAYLCRA